MSGHKYLDVTIRGVAMKLPEWFQPCAERETHTHVLSAPKFSYDQRQCAVNRNWCKLKHAQTWLYYDEVAWPPMSRIVRSFRERSDYRKEELKRVTCVKMKTTFPVTHPNICEICFNLDSHCLLIMPTEKERPSVKM